VLDGEHGPSLRGPAARLNGEAVVQIAVRGMHPGDGRATVRHRLGGGTQAWLDGGLAG
jgi:hypothetical protein